METRFSGEETQVLKHNVSKFCKYLINYISRQLIISQRPECILLCDLPLYIIVPTAL
jgi:hypothetical protein